MTLTTPDPGAPLTFADLTELADRIGYVPRRELHCHPGARLWLMIRYREAEPEFPGAVGSLTGIPVFDDAGLDPGAWELREDGEVTASGCLEVPPFVYRLLRPPPLDLEPVPYRVADRYRPWFPLLPPPPLSISSIV